MHQTLVDLTKDFTYQKNLTKDLTLMASQTRRNFKKAGSI